MIYIKSEDEIKKIRESCHIVGLCHKAIAENIKAGMSTMNLENIVVNILKKYGAKPSFKGQEGFTEDAVLFPYATCISINEEVIHGMPSKKRIIHDGDIVSLDIGAYKNGFHGDSAKTYIIGNVDDKVKKLVEVTRGSFYEGLKFAKVGYRVSDISNAVQKYVEKFGFSVVKDFQGHGVGRELHEDPGVPNYGQPGRGPRLEAGMTIAIEPMVNMGTDDIIICDDGWKVVTADGKLSSHYEHTVLITDGQPEILTNHYL